MHGPLWKSNVSCAQVSGRWLCAFLWKHIYYCFFVVSRSLSYLLSVLAILSWFCLLSRTLCFCFCYLWGAILLAWELVLEKDILQFRSFTQKSTWFGMQMNNQEYSFEFSGRETPDESEWPSWMSLLPCAWADKLKHTVRLSNLSRMCLHTVWWYGSVLSKRSFRLLLPSHLLFWHFLLFSIN